MRPPSGVYLMELETMFIITCTTALPVGHGSRAGSRLDLQAQGVAVALGLHEHWR